MHLPYYLLYHLEKLKLFRSALEIRRIFYRPRVSPKESESHGRLFHSWRTRRHVFLRRHTPCDTCHVDFQTLSSESAHFSADFSGDADNV